MKKIAKFLGIGVIVTLAAGLMMTLFIYVRPIPSYEVKEVSYNVESSPESIERGKKLVTMLCASCHMNRETGKLTGIHMKDAPLEFGEINSQNITQDVNFGIGDWTDAQLMFLLRTGIKKDGQYSPPYMAKLPLMADEDINAIISFLKSNDPMVMADDTPDHPTKPSILTKFLCRVAWKPFPLPVDKIEMPDPSNSVEMGRYLAHNLDCFSCHSADFKSNDFLTPVNSKGYFGGGNKPLNLEGEVVLTANLTPDEETGIGTWTREKFIKAVKSGIKEGEPALAYPMMPYSQLSDEEAGAIYDYLRTIAPIKNKVVRSSVSRP